MATISDLGTLKLIVANTTTDMLVAGISLAVLLLLAVQVLRLAERWRRQPSRPSLTAQEELAEYRRWVDEGLVSREEFERLKRKLEPALRAELDAHSGKALASPEELGKQLVPVPSTEAQEPAPEGEGPQSKGPV